MTGHTDPHVVWVTNLPAPYRFPVWEVMGERCRLTVLVMAQGGHRSWFLPNPVSYEAFSLEGSRIELRRADITVQAARVRRRLDKLRPDAVIVTGWDSPTYWIARRWARRHGAAVIALYESTIASHRVTSGPIAMVRSRFFRSVDATVVVGESSQLAVEAMGVHPSSVFVANNFSSLGGLESLSREVTDESAKGHRFLFVGRLIALKQVDVLIHAFAELAGSEDRLDIVGDGPERKRLLEIADATSVRSRIRFMGHLEGAALRAAFDGAQTLCLPSNREVWGLVVNEALSRGLHVVVSSAAGVAASVADFPEVFVVEPHVESILEGMRRSCASWTGHSRNPRMQEFGAEQFAKVCLDAVNSQVRGGWYGPTQSSS